MCSCYHDSEKFLSACINGLPLSICSLGEGLSLLEPSARITKRASGCPVAFVQWHNILTLINNSVLKDTIVTRRPKMHRLNIINYSRSK